jgi:thiol-disulfide isomerase/thioredoxin
MKGILLLLACLPFCTDAQRVRVSCAGLAGDSLYVMLMPIGAPSAADGERRMDTVVAHDGSFTYTLPVQHPAVALVMPPTAFYKRRGGGLYIRPAMIMDLVLRPTESFDVTATLTPDALVYSVTGSPFNDTLSTTRDVEDLKAVGRLEIARDQPRDTALDQRLFAARVAAQGRVVDVKSAFIRTHPASEVSAYLLCYGRVSDATFGAAYPRLAPQVREGLFRDVLTAAYEQYQAYAATMESTARVGQPAPVFAGLPKGKYVVLDFWGTWCHWCMMEMPRLTSCYSRYGKVAFLGIACNDKAIRDTLPWPQLLDNPARSIAVMYGVTAFPTKVLIDPGGTIVGRYVGIDEAFYKKLDEIGH